MLNTYQLTHLGGEHTVTGSCHLLQTKELNILVDCGLAQGGDSANPLSAWPIQPKELNYLFLTHAHVDHIGRLPELIDHGFRGEIICTHPTKALLEPMLRDALSFSHYDDDQSRRLLQKIDELSWGFEYNQLFKLKNGAEFELGRAGHILGSCFIRLQIADQSIIFSGDLGNTNTPLVCDPDLPGACDLLVLESTYGDRLHEGRDQRLARLVEILAKALKDKGKVLIPAFALGRTQEILYEIDRFFCSRRLSKIPVVIDSPLGVRLTEVFKSQNQFWDREARKLLAQGDDPIDFDGLYSAVQSRAHQQLLRTPGPMIVIAGSGMCTGGRILDHLAVSLEDPKADIFFVGYQAEGTTGREIVKQSAKAGGAVSINGKRLRIKAKIHTLSGYSAHADQQGLLDWVGAMPKMPGKIKLVHGEPSAQKSLAGKLRERGYNVA